MQATIPIWKVVKQAFCRLKVEFAYVYAPLLNQQKDTLRATVNQGVSLYFAPIALITRLLPFSKSTGVQCDIQSEKK